MGKEKKNVSRSSDKIIAQIAHHSEADCQCPNCYVKRYIEGSGTEGLCSVLGETLWRLMYLEGRPFIEALLGQAMPLLEHDLAILKELRSEEP